MVLLLGFGAAVAAFGSFTTLLEQVLCVQGYASVRAHTPTGNPDAEKNGPLNQQKLGGGGRSVAANLVTSVQDFAGLCVVLFIFFGLVGAAALSFYVDRTKRFTEAIKVSMSLTALALIAFSLVRVEELLNFLFFFSLPDVCPQLQAGEMKPPPSFTFRFTCLIPY